MAIARETIVSLYKKGESNSTIAKELLHLVGEGLEVLLKDAANQSLADSSLCGQFGHRTTGICPQLLSRVFNHSLGSHCSLSALAQ